VTINNEVICTLKWHILLLTIPCVTKLTVQKLKHKNQQEKKSGNMSKALRSVRQTETDYGGTGGEKDLGAWSKSILDVLETICLIF